MRGELLKMGKNFSKHRLSRSIEVRNFFNTFFHKSSIGGVFLLICSIISLIFANIPSLGGFHAFWGHNAGISIGSFSLEMTLSQWINDGLMAVFFFVVGLEIKREMLVGELSTFLHAALPVFAAIGGMLVPACIYFHFNYGTEAVNGWGIPMATDIAFALGVVSLLGNKVPVSLKVFLTALAIVDDLGAIIVLAVFYPAHALHPEMLFYAALVVLFLLVLNWNKVRRPMFYIVPGVVLWWLILQSGIHATIAGVILAMTIPSKTSINEASFYVRVKYLLEKFKAASNGEQEVLANPEQQHIIHQMNERVRKIDPLMHRFEAGLHPWVTFFIMPVFALVNAGVPFTGKLFALPVPTVASGIFFGLLVGKPLGILLFSWLSVKLHVAQLPQGTRWRQIFALGIIAGIGFTMSIFIDGLAFEDESYTNIGKAAILCTSFVAAVAGLVALIVTCRPGKRKMNKNENGFNQIILQTK